MLKEYPKYKKGELEVIYSKLDNSDKKLITEFVKTISAGENKINDMKRSIIQFRNVTNKPFKEITFHDLELFIPLLDKSDREKYTKNSIKIHIKRFLKFVHEDWFVRFKDFSCIHCVSNARNEKKINSGNMLSRDTINELFKQENDIIKKTFFLTLYESACRPIELRLLKWKDIKFNVDGDISELNLYSTKTEKSRVSFVFDSTFWLQKLEKGKPNEYVFQSREGDNQPITKITAIRWIKEIGKKSKIDIYPYLLRHSRATELHKLVNEGKMSEKIASQIMGHSVKTFNSYGELDRDVIKDQMKTQLYKLEDLPPERKNKLEKDVLSLKKEMKLMQDSLKEMQLIVLKNFKT